MVLEPSDKGIWVERFDDISIVVYVVGYPREGESIILTLQNKDKPVFTVVTDCYKEGVNNYTAYLLREIGVKEIDAFIWTHPDRDHSLGIIDMLSEFDKKRKAKIFVPQTFNGGQWYHVCKEAQKAIVFLRKKYITRKRELLGPVGLLPGESPRVLLRKAIYCKYLEKPIYCKLRFIAPDGTLAEKKDGDRKDFTLNDLSLVYLFSINDCHYLFTGDLLNRTVQFIKEQITGEEYDNYLDNLSFIKIPHHGSKSSADLIDLLYNTRSVLESDNEVGDKYCKNVDSASVSTVFVNDNLPEKAVLEGYCTITSRVYCTGSEKGNPYGCVKLTYSFGGEFKTEPELYGNAYPVFGE